MHFFKKHFILCASFFHGLVDKKKIEPNASKIGIYIYIYLFIVSFSFLSLPGSSISRGPSKKITKLHGFVDMVRMILRFDELIKFKFRFSQNFPQVGLYSLK